MSTARPGTALKSLRKRNQWTLADVAKRTGIPPSTLSRIENDQISPTYDMLLRLGQGLSIDLSQLLSEAPAEVSSEQPGRRSVNRSADGDTVPMSNHTLRYLSTDLLNKQMTPDSVRVPGALPGGVRSLDAARRRGISLRAGG